jgi:uncharacterized protein
MEGMPDVSGAKSAAHEAMTLLDWKRTIFGLYQQTRDASDPKKAWNEWRDVRDRLFRTHPQSPLSADRRAAFGGCRYYEYTPAFRVLAQVVPADEERREIVTSTGATYTFSRIGKAEFELASRACSLSLYWLEGYGGGVFLPFGDATSGVTTYPAGRYLLDTVKGADLGAVGDRLVLDFNYAYNPSCAYDPRWICPLSPTENWLPTAVEAGEQTP